MKVILSFFFTLILFLQSGCATRPTLEEQDRQDQKTEQSEKKSDAFAKGLPQ
jgi:hypothetical protein